MILIRSFDIIFSFLGIIFFFPLLFVIYIFGMFENGSPLFIQERVGKDRKPFNLVKFRTMDIKTAWVASHLANNVSFTFFGKFLRKTKLDELPQLWNVIVGDMSIVGPRPNLYNQKKLIKERVKLGVYEVRPGITGLSQIQQIDMSTPILLAKTDKEMIETFTKIEYFKYILVTLLGKGFGDKIKI